MLSVVYAECRKQAIYAERCYAECRRASLSVTYLDIYGAPQHLAK